MLVVLLIRAQASKLLARLGSFGPKRKGREGSRKGRKEIPPLRPLR